MMFVKWGCIYRAHSPPNSLRDHPYFPYFSEEETKVQKGLTIGLRSKWQRGERSPNDMFLPHPYRTEGLAGWSRKPGGPKAGATVPPWALQSGVSGAAGGRSTRRRTRGPEKASCLEECHSGNPTCSQSWRTALLRNASALICVSAWMHSLCTYTHTCIVVLILTYTYVYC